MFASLEIGENLAGVLYCLISLVFLAFVGYVYMRGE
jgi:hypothetical protein